MIVWLSSYPDPLPFENLKCPFIFVIFSFGFIFTLVALFLVGISVVNGKLYFILFVHIDLFRIIFILKIGSRFRQRVRTAMREFWEKWVIGVLDNLELSVRVETKDSIEQVEHKADTCHSQVVLAPAIPQIIESLALLNSKLIHNYMVRM